MPYIDRQSRDKLQPIVDAIRIIFRLHDCTKGELNYLITKTCNEYLNSTKADYSHFNDVLGALECAKLEGYRRVCVPYEDSKRKANGDVYGR